MVSQRERHTDDWVISYDADNDHGVIAHGGVIMAGLQFQHGPIQENGFNGIQNEPLIDLLHMRITALQERFPCEENVQAMAYLDSALIILNERTRKRQEQGVEGKNEAHVS